MRPYFRVLLWPVSALYGLIVRFRNHLYHIGYKKSFSFQCTVISVGNLSVGGNGKTPMVEYLIGLLSSHERIAVLSRGYGRKTHGFRLANQHDNASTIGDEPMQMYRKFQPDLTVAVGESRALAIPKILFENPEVKAIVLDDAFQHRSVKPQLSILVTDYWSPFFEDSLMPSGRLREPKKGVSRADVVVVTKCPQSITDGEKNKYTAQIQSFSHRIPVFFTSIEYMDPVHFFTGKRLEETASVLLVSGIAKSDTLVQYVSEQYTLVKHLRFGDHFQYGKKDINQLKEELDRIQGEQKIILTTEKDMVRLMQFESELMDLPLYYLPIESSFLEQGNKFNEMVLNSLGSVK